MESLYSKPPQFKVPIGSKIMVGMSGGVDSSVAAYLLRHWGYDPVGVFMKNWQEGEDCPWEKDYRDVVEVSEKLGIPYYTLNLSQEYWDEVFSWFLQGYRAGQTPNPDILCNQKIKFSHFFAKRKLFGCDYLATGHYAQKERVENSYRLKKAVDQSKDQTYFLYTLKSEVLEKVLFPLGHLTKAQVRQIAREQNLITQDKKDSTGICFIGEKRFREFLARYLTPKKGYFITPEGKVVGEHQGAHFYTVGQRKGLGIGGLKEYPQAPWFVVEKDTVKNQVTVVQGENHPLLFRSELILEDLQWVETPPSEQDLFAKIRHRQEDQKVKVFFQEEGKLHVKFKTPQKGVAPMQSVVLYSGDFCLGGGLICPKTP